MAPPPVNVTPMSSHMDSKGALFNPKLANLDPRVGDAEMGS